MVITVVLSVAVSGCNTDHQENCHYDSYDESCFCFLWRGFTVQEVDKPSDGEKEKTETSHTGGELVRSFPVVVVMDFLDRSVLWFTCPSGVEFVFVEC